MIKLLICDDNPEITKQIKELISIFEKKYRLKFQIDIKNSGDFILKDNKSYDIAIVDFQYIKYLLLILKCLELMD